MRGVVFLVIYFHAVEYLNTFFWGDKKPLLYQNCSADYKEAIKKPGSEILPGLTEYAILISFAAEKSEKHQEQIDKVKIQGKCTHDRQFLDIGSRSSFIFYTFANTF